MFRPHHSCLLLCWWICVGLQVHSTFGSFQVFAFCYSFVWMCTPWQQWDVGGLNQFQFLFCMPLVNLKCMECLSIPDGCLTSQNFQLNTFLLLPCLPLTGLQPQAREPCVLSLEATLWLTLHQVKQVPSGSDKFWHGKWEHSTTDLMQLSPNLRGFHE